MQEMNLLPSMLAVIAAGRDHVTTHDFGRAVSKAPQTIRKEFCLKGEAYGIRPIKIGNRLLWSVTDIASLLNKGAT
jgi:hypothetical protein